MAREDLLLLGEGGGLAVDDAAGAPPAFGCVGALDAFWEAAAAAAALFAARLPKGAAVSLLCLAVAGTTAAAAAAAAAAFFLDSSFLDA